MPICCRAGHTASTDYCVILLAQPGRERTLSLSQLAGQDETPEHCSVPNLDGNKSIKPFISGLVPRPRPRTILDCSSSPVSFRRLTKKFGCGLQPCPDKRMQPGILDKSEGKEPVRRCMRISHTARGGTALFGSRIPALAALGTTRLTPGRAILYSVLRNADKKHRHRSLPTHALPIRYSQRVKARGPRLIGKALPPERAGSARGRNGELLWTCDCLRENKRFN